jgi:hypothetical protein
LSEKGSQVALMRQIYQNSECTVVYLGDETDDLVITFLNDFMKKVKAEGRGLGQAELGFPFEENLQGYFKVENGWDRCGWS